MKSSGLYWEGKNGNKWTKNRYTKEQAVEIEKSLIECYDCFDCSRCSGCSDCSRCSGCSDCSGCSGCSDFKENPNRYTGQKMGSRNLQTTIYWTKERNQVVCGCFTGTLEEFRQRVMAVHGDNEYGKQYLKFIGIVEVVMRMESES